MVPPSIIATLCPQLREIEMAKDSGQAAELEIEVAPRMVAAALDELVIDVLNSEDCIKSI